MSRAFDRWKAPVTALVSTSIAGAFVGGLLIKGSGTEAIDCSPLRDTHTAQPGDNYWDIASGIMADAHTTEGDPTDITFEAVIDELQEQNGTDSLRVGQAVISFNLSSCVEAPPANPTATN